MIAVFMVLIMTKKLTPVLALIIVPTVFGLFAGAGLGIGDMVMDSMKSMTSTAALLMFAIIYFGLMIDVGLFDPLDRKSTRLNSSHANISYAVFCLQKKITIF